MPTTTQDPAPAEARRPAAPPPGAHRPEVQGLRAVAVVLVVLYHADVSWLGGGYIGVDVFFVISGFVITLMLLRTHDATDRVDLRSFYLRRSRRILPALALLTVVVMPLSLLLGPVTAHTRTVGTGIAASLFSANVYLLTLGKGGYFDAPATTNALVHTWSLSLEEQFYLVFPALLLTTAMVARRRWRLRPASAATIAAVSAASFALCWAATTGRLPDARLGQDFAFYAMPTRVWEFGIGALLAVGARWLPRRRGSGEVLGWGGLVFIGVAATQFSDLTPFPGSAALLPTVGTGLVIAGASAQGTTVRRALSLRPLTAVGDLSYSWYLWHWPVIVFCLALFPSAGTAVTCVAAASSLIPAIVSYRWVERPIRFGAADPSRTIRMALACIAVPVALGLALLPISRATRGADGIVRYEHQTRSHADTSRGCGTGRTELPDPTCTWPVGSEPRPTPGSERLGNVLLGDSNAGHLSEPFIAASHAQGRDATIETKNTCPFIDLDVFIDRVEDPGCRRFVRAMLDEAREDRPDAVVISTALDRYLADPAITFVDDDGRTARTPEDKADAWSRSVRSMLDELEAAGVPVVLVMPIPKFVQWDPRACATVRMLTDPAACGTTDSTAAMEARRAHAARVQRAVADGAAGITLVDPLPVICPEAVCAAHHDGQWWWRDNGHLTVAGAELLTPALTDALDPA